MATILPADLDVALVVGGFETKRRVGISALAMTSAQLGLLLGQVVAGLLAVVEQR